MERLLQILPFPVTLSDFESLLYPESLSPVSAVIFKKMLHICIARFVSSS